MSMVFFPLLSVESQLKYLNIFRMNSTVTHNPSENPTQVVPDWIAEQKDSKPKNTQTESHPKYYTR